MIINGGLPDRHRHARHHHGHGPRGLEALDGRAGGLPPGRLLLLPHESGVARVHRAEAGVRKHTNSNTTTTNVHY